MGLQTGLEFSLLSIIDNIVNGEYLLPPGEKEEFFALVREVGAGYTIVGSTYFYNDPNQLLRYPNGIRVSIMIKPE